MFKRKTKQRNVFNSYWNKIMILGNQLFNAVIFSLLVGYKFELNEYMIQGILLSVYFAYLEL